MKTPVVNLARVLEMLWQLCMGLFLGLTGGLVLAVILTFRGARAIAATPGIEPFSDPRFEAYAQDAVAGYIGQDLFRVGGSVALGLLGLAVVVTTFHARHLWRCIRMTWRPGIDIVGHRFADRVRSFGMAVCIGGMLFAAMQTNSMNQLWSKIYDTTAEWNVLDDRREQFEQMHKDSERAATLAWLGGFIALMTSPWCRRPADTQREAMTSLNSPQ